MTASPSFEWARDHGLIDRLTHQLGTPSALLTAASARGLGNYLELVSTWNRKLDLTAARTPPALVEVMLADSFQLAAIAEIPPGSRLVDVGSGAGAPILPLLLLREDLSATLVEPLRKRVAFLRTAVGSLGLVSRARVVEHKLDPRAPGARLFPEIGLELAARTLVLLAGQAPPTAPDAVLESLLEYRLPQSGAERRIACYARVTPGAAAARDGSGAPG